MARLHDSRSGSRSGSRSRSAASGDRPRAAFLALALPALAFQGTPIERYLAGYPYGTQTALEVTPDRRRAFVARGAAISVLDLDAASSTLSPPVATVEVPDASPMALAYHEHPFPQDPAHPVRQLFIAGGTLGLRRLTLCDSLFLASGPTGCADYASTLIELVGDGSDEPPFERKRCVDLAIVHGNALAAGNPVLFALFAASSDAAESAHGGSELRAYRLNPNGVVRPFAALTAFPAPTRDPPGSGVPGSGEGGPPPTVPVRPAAGTALASDAGDSTCVYVALGKDSEMPAGEARMNRIWKVTIGGTAQAPTLEPAPLLFETLPTSVNVVRDMTVVRAPTPSGIHPVLYAALGYGGILEYDLTTSQRRILRTKDGFPERIAAVIDGARILLGVGMQGFTPGESDSHAPRRNNGRWTSPCIGPGVPDPDGPHGGIDDPAIPAERLDLYLRAGPGGPAGVPALTLHASGPGSVEFWSDLFLREVGPSRFRVYACATNLGTAVDEITIATSVRSQSLALYRDVGIGAAKVALSRLNPGLLRYAADPAGAVTRTPGTPMYVTNAGAPQAPDIVEIPRATLCPLNSPLPADSACRHEPPAKGVALLREARWTDVDDPSAEWWAVGELSRVKWALDACSGPIPEDPCADPCPVSPLAPLPPRRPGWKKQVHLPDADTFLGWFLFRWTPGNAQPAGGEDVQERFWQFAAPSAKDVIGPGLRAEQFEVDDIPPVSPLNEAANSSYFDAALDPRTNERGNSVLFYGTRQRSAYSLKIFELQQLLDRTADPAAPFFCGGNGVGQSLESDLNRLDSHQVLTHFELESDAFGEPQCVADIPCGPTENEGTARSITDTSSLTFELVDPQANSWFVTAVAAGAAVSAQSGPPCRWLVQPNGQPVTSQPMIVLYDVTETGDSFEAPRLLRVGLGYPEDEHHEEGLAFGEMAVKTYGTGPAARTYLFVGDFLGRLLVFDVSYDELFRSATTPYRVPGSERNPILSPVRVVRFPKDPYDGWPPNCIQVQLEPRNDPMLLYCALGRAGIGIVDVADPTAPTWPNLIRVIDTPSIVQGLAFRSDPNDPSRRQLLVADMRCGFRLYEE